MPPGPLTLYQANIDDFRLQDIVGATVKFALVGSGYTPDAGTSGHSLWSSVSANEIANGNGYTTGGYTVTTDSVVAITNGWKYTSENVAWTASGGSIPQWRYCVVYISGSLWGKTNPLLGYFLGDSTPTDVPATASGQTLTLGCPQNGWLTVLAVQPAPQMEVNATDTVSATGNLTL